MNKSCFFELFSGKNLLASLELDGKKKGNMSEALSIFIFYVRYDESVGFVAKTLHRKGYEGSWRYVYRIYA